MDNIERPIASLSKAFIGTQLNWATIQKEAYAIYFCCKNVHSLLSDRKFSILTDHHNLIQLKTSSNPVIIRWALSLSELDFSLGFIKGSKNVIADSMSRLCENNMLMNTPVVAPLISSAIVESEHPSPDQHALIASHHNSSVGHMGVQVTLKRMLSSNLTWKYMRQHVKHFLRNCPVCQKLSAVKFPTHSHPFTTSSYSPMQVLNIDFIGPFPDKGYILTVIDTFTRWVELYHTVDKTTSW